MLLGDCSAVKIASEDLTEYVLPEIAKRIRKDVKDFLENREVTLSELYESEKTSFGENFAPISVGRVKVKLCIELPLIKAPNMVPSVDEAAL